jgi:hypothetical protein
MFSELSDAELPDVNKSNRHLYSDEQWIQLVSEWRRRYPIIAEHVADLREHFPEASVEYIGRDGKTRFYDNIGAGRRPNGSRGNFPPFLATKVRATRE